MTKPKQEWRCQKCSCRAITIPRAAPRSKLCLWCAKELHAAGLRWCSKCRSGQPAAAWTTAKAGYCRTCQRAQNQHRRAEHYDAAIQYGRDYFEAHHDELLARNRADYREKREQRLAQKKAYYQQHAEEIKTKVRRYRPRRRPESIAKERRRQRDARMRWAGLSTPYRAITA